jgi:dipeptidyl aminopeptidase/acylaminoacyl peptidase
MICSNRYKYGAKHWVISYWKEIIGDKKTELEKLKSISPVNFAQEFKAPVLLIHGEDDTVVKIGQSEDMRDALEDAKKQVTFVELEDEDHWLSTSSSRQSALTEIDKFLNKYNPIY